MTSFYSRKIFKVAVVSLIFGLLVFFNPNGFFDGVRGVFFRITYPFQKIFYVTAIKISDGKDVITSIGELKEENKNLSEENNRLLSEIAKLTDIEKENENLREHLNLLPQEKFNMEGAQVIGQNLTSGGWLVIDKGTRDGIRENMPVIVYDGILVGKVGKVFSRTAQINFLTNSESVVSAVVSATEARGIVRGDYGLGMTLDMVMQKDVISEGNDVITSGLNEEVPRGMYIGKIENVGLSQDHLFQQASIISPVDYSKLRYVFVIKNQKE